MNQETSEQIEERANIKAFTSTLETTFYWILYCIKVGEGEQLALLLLSADTKNGSQLADKHRAALEGAVSRWPKYVSEPLLEAFGHATMIACGFSFDERTRFLSLQGVFTKLVRQDVGPVIAISLNDDAIVDMHSWLQNKNSILGHLQPLIDDHDKHLVHISRMQKRLKKLTL